MLTGPNQICASDCSSSVTSLLCPKEQKALAGSRGSSFSILRHLIATKMRCDFRTLQQGQQFSIKFYIFFSSGFCKHLCVVKPSCSSRWWAEPAPCRTAAWGQGAGIPVPPGRLSIAVACLVLLSCCAGRQISSPVPASLPQAFPAATLYPPYPFNLHQISSSCFLQLL